MKGKFEELANLGAGEFEHIDGTLIDHLSGTKKLLEEWDASLILQDAGLYHAAYGTSEFSDNLVSLDQRGKISAIIGKESEKIVYEYCACQRDDFFSEISKSTNPQFKNRFTSEDYYLSDEMIKNFCELTAANESEIAIDNPEFIKKHGAELKLLFIKMAPYLSEQAQQKTTELFGGCTG